MSYTCRNCIHNKVCRKFEDFNAIEPERTGDKVIYHTVFTKNIENFCEDFCKEFDESKKETNITTKATVDTDRGFAYCGRCDNILASVYTYDRENEMICENCGTINKGKRVE